MAVSSAAQKFRLHLHQQSLHRNALRFSQPSTSSLCGRTSCRPALISLLNEFLDLSGDRHERFAGERDSAED